MYLPSTKPKFNQFLSLTSICTDPQSHEVVFPWCSYHWNKIPSVSTDNFTHLCLPLLILEIFFLECAFNEIVFNGLCVNKLSFEGIPISGKWNSRVERQKGKNSMNLQLCKMCFWKYLGWIKFKWFLRQLKHVREKFHHEICLFLVFPGRRKSPWVSHHLISFAWLFCEKLETCKHFYVDNEMENGRHRNYNSAMDTPDPENLLEKLHFVFDSLKCKAKLNLALCFVLKNVEDRSFRFCYAHKNTIGEIKSCGYYRRQDKTQESPK